MVAWRYEISLLVLKNIFQHSQRNFVFPRGHVISSIEPAGRRILSFMGFKYASLVCRVVGFNLGV